MLTIRKSEERGHANYGWLDTNYSFSFANYYDPKHMGFRALRVINDDRVAAGRGFGTHPHDNMEILTYVLSGKIAHKDSMGHQEEIGPNEVQYMSAGTGLTHSEFNPSPTDEVHLLQIWIEPKKIGVKPQYGQFAFDAKEKQNKLRLIASGEEHEGAARINQDAKVYVTELSEGSELGYELGKTRHAWVHVAQGKVELNGQVLSGGDGAAVSGEAALALRGLGDKKNEVLIFDLA
jgi:quercetin 2,3-dioxygenase